MKIFLKLLVLIFTKLCDDCKKNFPKKKSKTKYIIITLALLFIIMTVYYFLVDNRDEFVILPENKKPFYIIPEDRGGQKVENL